MMVLGLNMEIAFHLLKLVSLQMDAFLRVKLLFDPTFIFSCRIVLSAQV
jgi:hypothetical protein